jgi:hypothetical protein
MPVSVLCTSNFSCNHHMDILRSTVVPNSCSSRQQPLGVIEMMQDIQEEFERYRAPPSSSTTIANLVTQL